MTRLMELAKPLPHASHVMFYAMDDKGPIAGEDQQYYANAAGI